MEVIIDDKVEKFLKSISQNLRTRATKTLVLLENLGKNLGPPYSKKIRNNLYELRVKGKIEMRFFYFFKNNEIIIVMHAIVKKTRKIPRKDIKLALKRIEELT